MHEVLGLRIWIGACVDQDEVSAFPGYDGRQSRAGHPFHRAKAQGAAGHQGTGVAAADHPGRVATFHQFDRLHHGGVALALEGKQRLVLHRDDFGGVQDRQAVVLPQSRTCQQGIEDRLISHQCQRVEMRVLLPGEFDRRYDTSAGPMSPPMASTAVRPDAPDDITVRENLGEA